MQQVNILDVTLRDGGYVTDFNFSPETVETVLKGLDQARIRYLEIGYRNGSFKPMPNIGVAGLCAKKYLLECRSFIKNSKLTVMLHPKNIAKNDLEEMRDCGVDCLRICFPVKDEKLGFDCIEMVQKLGFEFFVNITRASQLHTDRLCQLVSAISQYEVNAIYLADSNGHLIPEQIKKIFALLKSRNDVDFGFHAHDNLFLAQANSLAAIESNVKYIDASLNGLGKSAGNLHTEGIVGFLYAKNSMEYDLCRILELAEYVKQEFASYKCRKNFTRELIAGLFNLSQDDVAQLDDSLSVSDYYEAAKKRAKE